jgi:hypothetical protein
MVRLGKDLKVMIVDFRVSNWKSEKKPESLGRSGDRRRKY